MNSKASALSISITFSSFSDRKSPITMSLVALNLRVIRNFFPLISLTLTSSKSSGFVWAILLRSAISQRQLFLFFLPVISSMTIGQLVMFLMTALVFLQSFLNRCNSQSDFLSCNRFSILAFSTSIDWNFLFLREQLRLPFPLPSEPLFFFPIIVVILLRRSLFSLSISVYLFQFCICFFLGLRVTHVSLLSGTPVLGRIRLI